MNPSNAPRVSASLGFLKGITAVMHPVMPMTTRESRLLLRAVQDSFRQQLATTSSDFERSSSSSQDNSEAAFLDPRARYISPNAHLGSVLKMPPFAPSAEKARTQREERIKRYLVDPIGVFEEHVALGTSSIELAKSCLARYNDGNTDMDNQSGGGSQVLRGLVIAGLLERPESFLQHVPLSHALIVALVREHKEDLVLRWMLEKEDTHIALPRQLIRQVEKQIGLERAIEIFFSFYTHLSNTLDAQSMVQYLGVVGRELCKEAKQTRKHLPSHFTCLLSTSVHWARSKVEHAMIQLRYGGSTRPGLEFFAAIDAKPCEWWAEVSEGRRRRCVQMGIELANKCLQDGSLDDARTIARLLTRRFPNHTGLNNIFSREDDVGKRLDVFRGMFKGATSGKKEIGDLVLHV
jgi:hypothetical protein